MKVAATTRTSSTVGAAATTAPDPQSVFSHVAGTWGACGSWWSDTATEMTSGSVCGVDGLVAENGVATQLVEPLVTVSRYVCLKRKRAGCSSQNFQGTVRRTEMTVDPLLRRATIRGLLGGCNLDVEFVGVGPAQPGGNLAEYHGLGGGPQISVSGAETHAWRHDGHGGALEAHAPQLSADVDRRTRCRVEDRYLDTVESRFPDSRQVMEVSGAERRAPEQGIDAELHSISVTSAANSRP